jgi:hypothetical protein
MRLGHGGVFLEKIMYVYHMYKELILTWFFLGFFKKDAEENCILGIRMYINGVGRREERKNNQNSNHRRQQWKSSSSTSKTSRVK